jgi:hypothetical protein
MPYRCFRNQLTRIGADKGYEMLRDELEYMNRTLGSALEGGSRPWGGAYHKSSTQPFSTERVIAHTVFIHHELGTHPPSLSIALYTSNQGDSYDDV